jgi:hypothetical protein
LSFGDIAHVEIGCIDALTGQVGPIDWQVWTLMEFEFEPTGFEAN